MNPVEVLALELRQFSGENGLRTLVPTLYGQTEEARGSKSPLPAKNWDEQKIFGELAARHESAVVNVARSIADWMKAHADRIVFGHGKVDGSMNAIFMPGGERINPLSFSTTGKLYISFGYCKRGSFYDPSKRQEWLNRLNQIPGLHLPPDSVDKYPGVSLAFLSSENRVAEFLKVMDWFVSELSLAQTA